MPIQPFTRLTPDSRLSASEMNRLFAAVERLSRVRGTGGVTVQDTGAGLVINGGGDDFFWIKITGSVSSGAYPWTEQGMNPPGTWGALAGGRSGTTTNVPAYPHDGNASVPTNSIVLATISDDGAYVIFLDTTGGAGADGSLGLTQFANGSGGFVNATDAALALGATETPTWGIYQDGVNTNYVYYQNNGGLAMQLAGNGAGSGLSNGVSVYDSTHTHFSLQPGPTAHPLSWTCSFGAGSDTLTIAGNQLTISCGNITYSPTNVQLIINTATGTGGSVTAENTNTGFFASIGSANAGTMAGEFFIGGFGSSSFAYIGYPAAKAMAVVQNGLSNYTKIGSDSFGVDVQAGPINSNGGYYVGGGPFSAYQQGLTQTVTLAKLTSGGTNGSLTIVGGIVTGYTAPS